MTRKTVISVTTAVSLLAAVSTVAFVKREAIAYRFNDSRAKSLLNKSIEAGNNGEWERAEQLAQSAWQLRNGNVEVLRQWFQASLNQRSRNLLVTARALFEHPDATAEDRKEALQLHLNIGDLVTFQRFSSRLTEAERADPDILAMAARYSLARNDLRSALQLVDKLGAIRNDLQDQLLAAEVLSRLSSKNDEAGAQVQTLIAELFRNATDPQIALSAFSLLQRVPPAKRNGELFSDAAQRLDELEEVGAVPTTLRLLALELEAIRDSDLQGDLVDKAIARYLTTDPLPLAEWLLAKGEAAKLVEILPEERARESVALYQALVRAEMMTGNSENADRLLISAPSAMKPWVAMAWRGAIAAANKKRSASSVHWERAFEQAKLASGREALVELARIAAGTGNAEIRNRSLTEALKRPTAIAMPMADVAFLFSAFSEQNNSEDFLEVSRSLLASEPENPILINNVFWLELISDRVRRDLTEEMESLVEKFPELAALRSTLALALTKRGDTKRAIETLGPILPTIEEGSEKVGPTYRAVAALTLSRAGEVDRSDKIAAGIDWSGMMEVERDFFQKELASVSPDTEQIPGPG